jgi:hypothetical protein
MLPLMPTPSKAILNVPVPARIGPKMGDAPAGGGTITGPPPGKRMPKTGMNDPLLPANKTRGT